MELRDALFAALRYELADTLPEGFSFDGVDEKFLCALYDYANNQEVAHLVGDALERLGVLKRVSDDVAEPYRRRMSVAAYHAEQQRQAFETIREAFENEKIPYLPLKGLVIRKFYPEPWMRTAGDLDVLVRKEDLERAEAELLKNGAQHKKNGKHDVSIVFPIEVMLELHYRLLEDERANGAKSALDRIWQHVTLSEGFEFEYQMDDEWFYYYHLVHVAKHLQTGTCGIRPFLDLWMINQKAGVNSDEREKLLEEQQLLTFSKEAERLSEVWLSGAEGDEWTEMLEKVLLAGGTFGSGTTKILMEMAVKGGKFRYYLSRIFLPYSKLKGTYPILEKHPILFPLMQVFRWLRVLFRAGVRRHQKDQTKANHLDLKVQSIETLKEHLGL